MKLVSSVGASVSLALYVIAASACVSDASSGGQQTQRDVTFIPTILAPPGVLVENIGLGTSQMKRVDGMHYVERNGKTEEVQDLVQASPSKPEYAKWLTFRVQMALDVVTNAPLVLDVSQFILRTRDRQANSVDGSYTSLGIIDPRWRVEGSKDPWDLFPKELLRGKEVFSTTKLTNYSTAEEMYQSIGLQAVRPGTKIEFYLAFPAQTAQQRDLVLTISPSATK